MALENARLYEDARKLADRDPLTGFYNHRFLHERLGEEVIRAQRGRRPLSVLMLDLDDFKLVNDTFGHLFGDRVLTWTAELIRSTLRASDIPARYGGDEFAIILPETDGDEARSAAERILEAFRDRPFVGEQRGPVPIAASIGVATFPADGRTGTDLIAAADGRCTRSSATAATMPPPRPARPPPRHAVRADRPYESTGAGHDPPYPRTRVDGRPSSPILRFRRDSTRRDPTPPRGPAGSSDPPGVVASSPGRSPCSRSSSSSAWSLDGAQPARLGRPRACSPSPASRPSVIAGRARARDPAAGRGRDVRPDPVRPVALRLARCDRRRHRRGAGPRPAPTTSSSSAAGRTRGPRGDPRSAPAPGVPDSATILPIADLMDRLDLGEVADREPDRRGACPWPRRSRSTRRRWPPPRGAGSGRRDDRGGDPCRSGDPLGARASAWAGFAALVGARPRTRRRPAEADRAPTHEQAVAERIAARVRRRTVCATRWPRR